MRSPLKDLGIYTWTYFGENARKAPKMGIVDAGFEGDVAYIHKLCASHNITMLDIDKIKEELIAHFPEYSFFTTRRLTGRCVVAKKSKYYGADIFVKTDQIIVEAAIPEWTTRLILGAGAAYKKLTDRSFSEVALQIRDFLSQKYEVRLRT